MPFNPKIHHRRSVRLKGYDYSQAELYFITICCDKRRCLFGEISVWKMMLNQAGKIADAFWMEIPQHFPNAVLHEYIVMPNHIHEIVELKTDVNAVDVGAELFLEQKTLKRLYYLNSNPNQFHFLMSPSVSLFKASTLYSKSPFRVSR